MNSSMRNHRECGAPTSALVAHIKPLASIFVLATVIAAPGLAEEGGNGYLTEEDVFFDIPVASGASRFPQALNKAPASVIVIDRPMIEASGALTVPQLFRLLPGFQVYSPAYNHPVMNYHTLPDSFPSRLEVRINGRSAYEPFTNTVFWILQGLEMEDIDYIEVVRGSNVPAYGANAMNGSINIVTRSPLDAGGFTARATAGSNNTREFSAAFGQTLGDWSYRLSARSGSNDGFGSFEGTELDDDGDATSVSLDLLWAPTLSDKISLELGYTEADFTFDQGNTNVEPHEIFEWNTEFAYQHLQWEHQFNDRHSFKLLFTHNKTDLNAVESVQWLSDLIGFPPELVFPGLEDFQLVLGIDDGYSERFDLELSHTGTIGDALKFDWGAAARHDKAKSQLHFSRESSVSEAYYRLFGNLEYSLTHWMTFNFGASLGHADTIGSHPSYRFATNFHLNENNTVRFAANWATSPPTVLDAEYFRTLHQGDTIYDLDLISDPDIEEEERDSLELGYFGHFFDGRLMVDLKLFYEENRNLIDVQTNRDYQGPLDADNEAAFATNSLESEDQGFEAYLRWQPSPRWLLTSQYTRISSEATHHRRINPDRLSNRDNAVSPHLASIMVDYDLGKGFSLAGSWYYQDKVDWKQAPTVDSYQRLDLNLRKRFRIGDMDGRLEFIAENVLDEDIVDYRHFHDVDPRYYLRLVTEFR